MTTDYKTIGLAIDARGIATLALSRPQAHHALDHQMIEEITQVLDILSSHNKVRALLLASSGPTFCAGGDLNWMRSQFAASRAEKRKSAQKLATMLLTLYRFPKPVLCVVQGNSYGGGLGLIAASDIVIAHKQATFALTETKLGLIPATIGPFVIAKIGGAAARSIFITGRKFNALEGQGLGLVTQAVEQDEIEDALEQQVKIILSASPEAMKRAKELLLHLTAPTIEQDLSDAISCLADCWESPETKAGITAFFEGKKPPWHRS